MSDIRYNSWLHRSGTGGVYQDSSGKVGIGSSVPGNALEIYGTSSSVQIEVNGTGRYRGFEIHEGGTRKAYFQHDATDNCALLNTAEADLKFYTGDTQRMQLDGSGRLMIGNTAAANLYSVANNLVVGSGSGSEGITIYSDSTNDGFLVFADGQSDPAYRIGQIIYSHQQNKFHFRTNGNTDRLLIDNAGNVNISGVTTAKTFVPTEYQLGNRNLLYNGAMQVAQRATQVTGQSNVNDIFTVDRWKSIISNGGTYTIEQTVEGPADTGFNHAHRLTCTTADNAGQNNLANADGYVAIEQRLEGFDVQGIQKGTTSAKPLAISFWCKSNLTGTYNVEVYDNDNGRRVGSQFSVSSADTWEQKTFTFAGDTTGALGNDNGDSLRFRIFLAAGNNFRTGTNSGSWAANTKNQRAENNVSLSKATSNYFALTGVQMEVGSQPTPYEWIGYGDELLRCQRYFWQQDFTGTHALIAYGTITGGASMNIGVTYPCEMRSNPTVTVSSASHFRINDWSHDQDANGYSTSHAWNKHARLNFTKSTSNMTLGANGYLNVSSSGGSSYFRFNSEL